MIKTNCLTASFCQNRSDDFFFLPNTKETWIIETFATLARQSITPFLHFLMSLMTFSLLLLLLFEGAHTSKRKIRRSLESHLHINAEACLQDAACHSYCFIQPRRVWGLKCGVEGGAAPVRWINGVNNSLWRFSDYAHTDSPHSTGRQTKTAQSKRSTPKTHTYTHKNMFTNIGGSSMLL